MIPEKYMHSRSSGALIYGAMSAEKTRLVASSFLLTVNQLGEAMLPVLAGALIDKALDPTQIPVAWPALLAAFPVACLLIAVGYVVGTRLSERARIRTIQSLRLGTVHTVIGADRALPSASADQTFTTITSDTTRVSALVGKVGYAVCAAMAVLIATTILFTISWEIGLVILVGSPLVFWAVRKASRPVLGKSLAEQSAVATTVFQAIDFLQGLRVLRGIGGEVEASRRYGVSSQEAKRAYLAVSRAEAQLSAIGVVTTGLYLACVAVIGVLLAATNNIAVGGVIASFGLAQYLAWPIQVLMDLPPSFAQAKASAGRIVSLRGGSVREPRHKERKLTQAGSLDIVSCSANNLVGFDLHLEPGVMTGIVGVEDAIVDQLISLIGRETVPDGGDIYLDGLDLMSASASQVASVLTVAPHNAAVFSGDLSSNVFGTDHQDDLRDRLTSLLETVAATEIQTELTSRASGELGEFGSGLSGGQRQRVALARALAKETYALVLHEPTSAVDSVTEGRIIPEVKRRRGGMLTIVGTTSISWLRQCDEVVVVDQNGAMSRGPHEILWATSSTYRSLVA